jgi:Lon protease-like protein
MDARYHSAMADDLSTCLPLVPLPDVVHFPCTELRLLVSEPRYRRLVRDLVERDEEARRVGVVLLKPGWVESYEGRPEVFPGGTAGRMMDVELRADGSAELLLHGEFRFEVERELGGGEYRQAVVRPLEEPWLNESDAGIIAVRRAIVGHLEELSAVLGERFPLRLDPDEGVDADSPFEELVNRIAAEIDLPALRKLELLAESLPERGLSVLSILSSRKQVVDLLRPFRHLAGRSESN